MSRGGLSKRERDLLMLGRMVDDCITQSGPDALARRGPVRCPCCSKVVPGTFPKMCTDCAAETRTKTRRMSRTVQRSRRAIEARHKVERVDQIRAIGMLVGGMVGIALLLVVLFKAF